MSNIIIANHIINVTNDGLYSLNDLHKASGGDTKHQPAFFLRTDQTKELCAEIDRGADMQLASNGAIHSANMQSTLKVINGGPNRGTYVCKEL